MQEGVYRVLTLVSGLVVDVPIGTNLGLLHLFWMLLCGKLPLSRGAILPGLSAVGLSAGAVRRAWAALGQGSWTSDRLVQSWARVVAKRYRRSRSGSSRGLGVSLGSGSGCRWGWSGLPRTTRVRARTGGRS